MRERTLPSPSSRREFLAQSLILAAAAGSLALPAAAEAAGDVPPPLVFDVVIYGGTSAAVTAAIQAKRMGRSVAIVCPETHLGGLTTSGLGWTDCKNGGAVGGLAREFYHRVWQFYTDPAVWTLQTRDSYIKQKISAQPGPAIDERNKVMWTFEPHATEKVIEDWLASEKIPVFRNEWLNRKGGVQRRGSNITAITMLSGRTFQGRMFIDAGYEGDLMAAAGVRHRIGRDSQKEFNEPLNGIRFMIKGVDRYYSGPHENVDPYVTPGKPESGLLPGVESEWKGGAFPLGEADPTRLQSFNYRLCLTDNPANRIQIPKPDGYDERQFELQLRLLASGSVSVISTQAMPNRKTDSNGCDFIGGSFSVAEGWNYSDASYERRKQICDAHRAFQQGLIWTFQNHERVPAALRESLGRWGFAKDEFTSNSNWPHQIYVREARRMEGVTMVTQHHVQRQSGYEIKDSIGLGSYSLDSHMVRRIVLDGKIRDEGGFYVWWDRPYPLPYGCILPQKADATNLLVPVTISATHAAFGSIRMEPTYMILGQSAATAACLALDQNKAVQDLDYADLAKRLIADGQKLETKITTPTPEPPVVGA